MPRVRKHVSRRKTGSRGSRKGSRRTSFRKGSKKSSKRKTRNVRRRRTSSGRKRSSSYGSKLAGVGLGSIIKGAGAHFGRAGAKHMIEHGGGYASTASGFASTAFNAARDGYRAVRPYAAAALPLIMGLGDYHVSKNSFVTGEQVPSFDRGKHRTMVQHREYLGDITASTAFTLTSYDINPGVLATFPWLSVIAQQYDEYEFHGLVFEFRSLSADAVGTTNTALGSVVLATQYNSTLANFANKTQMENYEFATSGAPNANIMHAVECQRSADVLSHLYTRTAAVPSGQDQRMYDLGNFQIATVGMQSTTAIIGELWASYNVALYKEKLVGGQIGGNVLADHWVNTNVCVCSTSSIGTPSTGTLAVGSNLNTSISQVGTTAVITWPSNIVVGNYLVSLNIHCSTNGSVTTPGFAVGTNLSALAGFNLGASQSPPPGLSATFPYLNVQGTYKVTGPGATLTISGAAVGGASSNVDLYVVQSNGNLIT